MSERSEISSLTEKLEALLEQSEGSGQHAFDADQVAKIERLILFLERVDAIGWASKYVFWALLAAGAIIANLDRIQAWWNGQ